MLVWDCFSAHLVNSVKQKTKDHNTDMVVIPGSLTSVLLPLDVSLNKPMKSKIRACYNDWMMNGKKTYTKGRNMRAATLPTLCEWILKAWEELDITMIVKSFKKCGISNNLDGTEDDMLWDDDTPDAEDMDVDSEMDDPYDDDVTAQDWFDLYENSDDDDEEFLGF